jgi:hypothetical protein
LESERPSRALFCLLQRRPKADQASIIQPLEASDDTTISGVAKLMRD